MKVVSILALSVPLFVVGCGGSGTDQTSNVPTAYVMAKQVWMNAESKDYQFRLKTICFCLPQSDVSIIVRQGTVSNAFYIDSGSAVPPDKIRSIPTLSTLFSIADDAYARNAAQIRFTANNQLGYLETLYIDYSQQMVDEEIGYQTSEFTVIDP